MGIYGTGLSMSLFDMNFGQVRATLKQTQGSRIPLKSSQKRLVTTTGGSTKNQIDVIHGITMSNKGQLFKVCCWIIW